MLDALISEDGGGKQLEDIDFDGHKGKFDDFERLEGKNTPLGMHMTIKNVIIQQMLIDAQQFRKGTTTNTCIATGRKRRLDRVSPDGPFHKGRMKPCGSPQLTTGQRCHKAPIGRQQASKGVNVLEEKAGGEGRRTTSAIESPIHKALENTRKGAKARSHGQTGVIRMTGMKEPLDKAQQGHGKDGIVLMKVQQTDIMLPGRDGGQHGVPIRAVGGQNGRGRGQWVIGPKGGGNAGQGAPQAVVKARQAVEGRVLSAQVGQQLQRHHIGRPVRCRQRRAGAQQPRARRQVAGLQHKGIQIQRQHTVKCLHLPLVIVIVIVIRIGRTLRVGGKQESFLFLFFLEMQGGDAG